MSWLTSINSHYDAQVSNLSETSNVSRLFKFKINV